MAEIPPRDSEGLFWKDSGEQAKRNKALEDFRKGEEAALERERIRRGLATQPQPVDPNSIILEFAMSSDTATVQLSYLVDPYLPRRCVVGFFGRGSTAKSSFLATMAAEISDTASTLWVSVEELKDWIKVRHTKSGGGEATLAVVAAVATKTDHQGRVVGSSFNVYEHLEPAIVKAKSDCEQIHNPPRPLRFVVLDTAVGLTTWGKGESPNDDASVKKLLGYLQNLAEQHDVTIGIIGHSNKGKHEYFADTVAGASAWTNSPRLSFVHAHDKREEHACVLRVAKTNLTTRFAATYTTHPVHVLHRREEGNDSVLCRVQFGPIVWGEDESLRLFDAATGKEVEEDAGRTLNNKWQIVERVMATLLPMVHAGGEPVTREAVHAALGLEVNRRHWQEVDNALAVAHGIVPTRGAHGRIHYARKQ